METSYIQSLLTLVNQQGLNFFLPTTRLYNGQHGVWHTYHDDVIKWEQFPCYWTSVRVPGEFPAQRPVARSFDVLFDLRLNKRLSKQSWGWWFQTLSCPSWRHCDDWRDSDKCMHWLCLVIMMAHFVCVSHLKYHVKIILNSCSLLV